LQRHYRQSCPANSGIHSGQPAFIGAVAAGVDIGGCRRAGAGGAVSGVAVDARRNSAGFSLTGDAILDRVRSIVPWMRHTLNLSLRLSARLSQWQQSGASICRRRTGTISLLLESKSSVPTFPPAPREVGTNFAPTFDRAPVTSSEVGSWELPFFRSCHRDRYLTVDGRAIVNAAKLC
jgi:hypothetical protein